MVTCLFLYGEIYPIEVSKGIIIYIILENCTSFKINSWEESPCERSSRMDKKEMGKAGLLSMLQAIDAFLPIGAFTLSNGMETYVQQNKITCEQDLEEYLQEYARLFPYQDLGLFYLAYENADNVEKCMELDALCAAMKTPREIRVGSEKTGIRFLKLQQELGECPRLMKYWDCVQEKRASGFHPIALGIFAADQGMEASEAMYMYGYSMFSAIINNAAKLVPLSQVRGQVILAKYLPVLQECVEQAKAITEEELGISGVAYTIRCMQHERLYSRLYMS